MVSRRERIEAMLAEDPNDVFLRYSLAMELQREGQNAQSLELLNQLMAEKPPYVAAFFMAGQQLAAQHDTGEARRVLREGIEAARAEGDGHAAGEMSEFLASLGQQGE